MLAVVVNGAAGAGKTSCLMALSDALVKDEVSPAVRAELGRTYRDSGYQLKPLLKRIFLSKDFYSEPAFGTQIKSPVQLVVSTYKKLGLREVPTMPDFGRMTAGLGQSLFDPPNVAGWDDARWLDTATYLARWRSAGQALNAFRLDANKPPKGLPTTAEGQVALALRFWAEPHLTEKTHTLLLTFARRSLQDAAKQSWKEKSYPALLQNALRHLIVMSPDYQTA